MWPRQIGLRDLDAASGQLAGVLRVIHQRPDRHAGNGQPARNLPARPADSPKNCDLGRCSREYF